MFEQYISYVHGHEIVDTSRLLEILTQMDFSYFDFQWSIIPDLTNLTRAFATLDKH